MSINHRTQRPARPSQRNELRTLHAELSLNRRPLSFRSLLFASCVVKSSRRMQSNAVQPYFCPMQRNKLRTLRAAPPLNRRPLSFRSALSEFYVVKSSRRTLSNPVQPLKISVTNRISPADFWRFWFCPRQAGRKFKTTSTRFPTPSMRSSQAIMSN